MTRTYFFVRLRRLPEQVYCSDGEFHHALACGPMGFSVQLFRTFEEAARVGDVSVVKCDGLSVEVTS